MSKHFILRQFRRGREDDIEIVDRASDCHNGRNIITFAARNEIKLRIKITHQRYVTFIKGNALTKNADAATDQVERTHRFDIRHRSGQTNASTQFRIEAATPHKDLVWRVHSDIETWHCWTCCRCWHPAAARLYLGTIERCLNILWRIYMANRNVSRSAAEIFWNRNLGTININTA